MSLAGIAEKVSASAVCGAMTLGSGAIVLLILLVVSDVGSRGFFGEPFAWSVEVSGYLMATLALFGFAYAERGGANIRIEIGINAFPKQTREQIERLGRWLALVLVLVAAWISAEFCYTAWTNGQRAWGIIETPLWIPRLALAPAFVLLAMPLAKANCGASKTSDAVALGGVLFALAACLILRRGSLSLVGVAIPQPVLAVVVVVLALAFLASVREGLLLTVVLGLLCAGPLMTKGMTTIDQGLMLGLLLCALLVLGVQIAYALGLCALLALLFLLPYGQLVAMPERVWGATNSFELTAVPAFVLMGVLLLRSGITASVFRTLAHRLYRVPGGLAHASVLGCGIFSTVSGSSMATAATMGSVACPEMLKRGYDARLAFGAVAAGGTLGILIPPSIALIVYGAVVGASVTSLFMAGFLPGLLLILLFGLVIAMWHVFLPKSEKAAREPIQARSRDTLHISVFAGLITAVLGSIYVGIATPTEAGAVGAVGGLVICLVTTAISWAMVRDALLETLQVTAMLMLIVAFASVLTYVLDFTNVPKAVVKTLEPLVGQPLVLFLWLCVLYCILGMFIEPISMMLITLPIVFPLVTAAGFDPVWFGIVMVVLMEVGLLTPPIGVNLFVIKSIVPSARLQDIAVGAMPFLAAMAVLLACLYAWPEIALWLPARMR